MYQCHKHNTLPYAEPQLQPLRHNRTPLTDRYNLPTPTITPFQTHLRIYRIYLITNHHPQERVSPFEKSQSCLEINPRVHRFAIKRSHVGGASGVGGEG